MVRVTILLVVFVMILSKSSGQDFLQRVKGKIADATSGAGIPDVNVKLESQDVFSAQTDANGSFNVQVVVGRYKMSVSHAGYESRSVELLVIAGKESIVDIQLKPSARQLEAVEITSTPTELEAPGQRSLTIEKTLRIPANFFDPVRVATSYPGVVAANDQGNSIIVRGNSPNGLMWRLNGLNIVNPNHLANAGTFSDKPMANGGGTNILSAQMLGKTDFYTGAMPVNQGNALSGVIDMELRDGNKDKMEYTAQASLIGLDIAAEGPIGKNQRTSFLANYRYSTVGLLSQMGVDFGGEAISFQDLSFHLNTVNEKGGEFSFFGFGGLSKNEFNGKPTEEWEEDKDMFNIDYESATYAVGVNYSQPIGQGKLFLALGYSSMDQQRASSPSEYFDPTMQFWLYDNYEGINKLFSSQLKYQTALNKSVGFEFGIVTDYLDNSIASKREFGCVSCSFRNIEVSEGKVDGMLLQPFVNVSYQISPAISAETGIRYTRFSYNGTGAVEPRVQIKGNPSRNSSLQLSYSLTSQVQLPIVYANPENKNLELTKSHHIDLAYVQSFANDLQLKSSVYYQELDDVPVLGSFSTINLLESIDVPALSNSGKGENYGVDVTVEKQFFRQNYFLVGGSYYESKYRVKENIWRDSRFNGNYTFSAIHGKEWTKPEKRRAISLNTRLLYLGGMRYAPVHEQASIDRRETAMDWSNGFTEQFKDYFRLDVRLSFRKNKPNYTRTFAIDIQNLTSQQNEAYKYYDFVQSKIVTKYQLGIIPVLVYRIDF